jgi:hypothetical protein
MSQMGSFASGAVRISRGRMSAIPPKADFLSGVSARCAFRSAFVMSDRAHSIACLSLSTSRPLRSLGSFSAMNASATARNVFFRFCASSSFRRSFSRLGSLPSRTCSIHSRAVWRATSL